MLSRLVGVGEPPLLEPSGEWRGMLGDKAGDVVGELLLPRADRGVVGNCNECVDEAVDIGRDDRVLFEIFGDDSPPAGPRRFLPPAPLEEATLPLDDLLLAAELGRFGCKRSLL